MISILAQATAPSNLAAFDEIAEQYIAGVAVIAVAVGVLSLGWVAFRIVLKYTRGAEPTKGHSEKYWSSLEDDLNDIDNPY